MSKDQTDQDATTAGAAPNGAAPLLRTLGAANAAVCTDGFCEVPQLQDVPQRQDAARRQETPQLQELAPGQKATMGADE